MPAILRVEYGDGTHRDIQLPVETWILGGKTPVLVAGTGRVVAATIDPDHRIPDCDRTNNRLVAQQ